MSVESLALPLAVGTLGLLLLIRALSGLDRRGIGAWILAAVVTSVLWIRLLQYGLVRFAGQGFNAEFFLHLEPEAVAVAWVDQRRMVLVVFALLLVVLVTLVWLLRTVHAQVDRKRRMQLGVLGVLLLAFGANASPEWQLWEAWSDWRKPVNLTADAEQMETWVRQGLLDVDLVAKQDVQAEISGTPTNLVLVYLESVGASLIEHPDWPGLMPRLAQLQSEHGWLPEYLASAYITIEGITNSQCGTLLPYHRDSDSLASGGRLFDNLPCLGDVLSEAGYRQLYLGGALSEFAGKGAFLAAHGYDEVRGWEYWREHGYNQRDGAWGLGDDELFAEATDSIRTLKQAGQPFNVTLLTIGTHLPGYTYPGCPTYAKSDAPFLQALHCTDHLLGEWVDGLRAQGLLDDTLLVITADHQAFRSPGMRTLFGAAVDDYRLPLLVLGATDKPARGSGAEYDLAPTLIDLLGIDTDAGFLLGRSLLRPARRPPWLVTRYHDFLSRQAVDNNPAGCSGPATSTLHDTFPLSACGKRLLMETLGQFAAHYSNATARASCVPAAETYVGTQEAVESDDGAERFGIVVGGVDLTERFTYHGYRVAPGTPGLYALGLGPAGRVRELHYFSPDAAPEKRVEFEQPWYLFYWRPGPMTDDSESAEVMRRWDISQQAEGAILASARAHRPLTRTGKGWSLPLAQCREAFWSASSLAAD